MWWPSEQQWAREGDRDATVGGWWEVMVSRHLSVLPEAQHLFLSCTVTCCSNHHVSLCYWWWWQKRIFLVFHLYSSLSLSLFALQHSLGLTPSTDPLHWWLLPLLWVSWPISSPWGPSLTTNQKQPSPHSSPPSSWTPCSTTRVNLESFTLSHTGVCTSWGQEPFLTCWRWHPACGTSAWPTPGTFLWRTKRTC